MVRSLAIDCSLPAGHEPVILTSLDRSVSVFSDWPQPQEVVLSPGVNYVGCGVGVLGYVKGSKRCRCAIAICRSLIEHCQENGIALTDASMGQCGSEAFLRSLATIHAVVKNAGSRQEELLINMGALCVLMEATLTSHIYI